MLKVIAAAGFLLLGVSSVSGGAQAAVLFSDNFNSFSGFNQAFTGQQAGTGLTVQAAGSVAGWVNTRTNNALNAVDRGNGDYAIMFYDQTTMYYNAPLAANDLGTTYMVSFAGAVATYTDMSQATVAGDYVQFLLNDMSGATIGSYQYHPNLTTTAFSPASFTYAGTGTGSVFLIIKDGLDADSRFGGAIDDISISSTTTPGTNVPEPASLLLLAGGAAGIAALRRRIPTA